VSEEPAERMSVNKRRYWRAWESLFTLRYECPVYSRTNAPHWHVVLARRACSRNIFLKCGESTLALLYDAAACPYDGSVFIPPLLPPSPPALTSHQARILAPVERCEMGSVCICGERMYGGKVAGIICDRV